MGYRKVYIREDKNIYFRKESNQQVALTKKIFEDQTHNFVIKVKAFPLS